MSRLVGCLIALSLGSPAAAQDVAPPGTQVPEAARETEIQALRAELARISARLDTLEHAGPPVGATSAATEGSGGSPGASGAPAGAAGVLNPATPGAAAANPVSASTSASVATVTGTETKAPPELTATDRDTLKFFRATTINFLFDGYYSYNFNEPIGRVNLLRAYDVSSNSFSISQADIMVERLPTVGSRYGGRLDLMWGQATETLQGSPGNEQRPYVWRNVYQAYGSYLAPVGSGLQVDFGKFASALGNEGNYTQDQIAYSKAYLFNYLPFYHMGARVGYNLTPKVNFTYWLVNGIQQTEDFNGFKSQGFIFTLKPASTLTWNVDYYFGQEARDVLPTGTGLSGNLPQPGLPTTSINPAPNGRTHIFDTYATWQATPKLKLVGEADFVVARNVPEQQPGRVAIGEFAFQYATSERTHVGGRAEYFDDRSGLFSGTSQALKEVTFVADHLFAPGFLARAEYRRDFSNQHYFLTDTAGALVPAQTTATLGLVYWWGTKQGSW